MDGVDCSAFTQHICKALGKNTPRTAREQFLQGKPIPASEMKAGDLVFWDGTQKNLAPGVASHVGVYLGNGKIAQAGSSGVRVVDASTYRPSKKSRFIGARRF